MKKILLANLFLLLIASLACASAAEDWRVEIVPSRVTDEGKIIDVDPTAPFSVILTNMSGESLRVWKESNALGCHSLTFTVKPEGEDGFPFTLERPLQAWLPAVPEATVVEPGKSITLQASLGTGESEPGKFEGFPKGYPGGKATIQAHFTIRNNEFTKMKWVRACRVSSAPMEVFIKRDGLAE